MNIGNFPERTKRLEKILKETTISNSLPLFYESPIINHKSLKEKCINYILTSLQKTNPNKQYEFTENILYKYEKDIFSLPNKTPNGLILPKKDTIEKYEELHKEIVSIFKQFNIDQYVQSIHFPVNIRIVSGTISENDNRPRASSKLHSDIWAGEFSNTVMVFYAALGDIEGTGIEFYEPSQEFYPKYCKPLNDYNEGAILEKDSQKYNCSMKDGFAYFTDPFLLHRTIKKSNNLRISIDFRFISTEKCHTDIEIETQRHENYIPFQEWANIGINNSIHTEKTISESFTENISPKNSYPSKYTIQRKNAC